MILQRIAEAAYGRRNARRLLARGAAEHGARHFPLFVALHTAWLLTLLVRVAPGAPIDPLFLALYGVVLAGRVWVMASLGPYWTTRVVTLPGAPLVARGPYRWLRHPNYLVVAAEIAVVPLVFGEWAVAIVFSALNALLIAVRLRVEESALADRRAAFSRASAARR